MPQMVRYESEWFPEELVSSMEKLLCQPLEREFNKAWSTNKDYTYETKCGKNTRALSTVVKEM